MLSDTTGRLAYHVENAGASEHFMRSFVKAASDLLASCLVSPVVLVCQIEARCGAEYERIFHACGHVAAILPGYFGMCLRRAFYCGTVDACSRRCQLGFGVILSHRRVRIEDSVYVGNYALLGCVCLRQGCLIGSRASILSKGQPHLLDSQGRWVTPARVNREITEIGAYAWVGEGAVVGGDVGAGAMLAAGAVSSQRVPDGVMMAGNPARFVKRLTAS